MGTRFKIAASSHCGNWENNLCRRNTGFCSGEISRGRNFNCGKVTRSCYSQSAEINQGRQGLFVCCEWHPKFKSQSTTFHWIEQQFSQPCHRMDSKIWSASGKIKAKYFIRNKQHHFVTEPEMIITIKISYTPLTNIGMGLNT